MEPYERIPGSTSWKCLLCGGAVADKLLHNEFHTALALQATRLSDIHNWGPGLTPLIASESVTGIDPVGVQNNA